MYVKPGPHNNQYWYLLKIPGRIAYKQFPLQIKKQAKEWFLKARKHRKELLSSSGKPWLEQIDFNDNKISKLKFFSDILRSVIGTNLKAETSFSINSYISIF